MVNKAISLSERIDNLKTIEAKLFFTWAIPHSDDFGLLPVSIKKLKAIICPHWVNTIDDVTGWIEDIMGQKLWFKVKIHEEDFYFIANFFEHQTLRRDRPPQLWSGRGAKWGDFEDVKNQIDGNLFTSINRKSEKLPKKKVVERKPRGSVDDVKVEIKNHKQFPAIKKKYPHRDYEEIIEDMCEWWQKNKKSLPKTPILAFKNWLSKTKPDDDLIEKNRQEFVKNQQAKRDKELEGSKLVSKDKLKKLEVDKSKIGNIPN